MTDHLYDADGDLTFEAKLWYLDVCHGRVALLDEQREDFDHLRIARTEGRFYGSAAEAHLIEFQYARNYFDAWMVECSE